MEGITAKELVEEALRYFLEQHPVERSNKPPVYPKVWRQRSVLIEDISMRDLAEKALEELMLEKIRRPILEKLYVQAQYPTSSIITPGSLGVVLHWLPGFDFCHVTVGAGGISARVVRGFEITSCQFLTRLDFLRLE